MHQIGRMGKSVFFGIDKNVDAALPPKLHLFGFMLTDLGKAQNPQKLFQHFGIIGIGGEFDKFYAA